jgi:hypothetical protein
MREMEILRQQARPTPVQRQNRWHHIDMPKANLRVLESPAGPFHKAECSVCGEKFYVPPDARDFKMDMLKQFDTHLFNQHRRQSDAQQKKRQRPNPA